ncbi:MAG: hypothetical protein LKE51_12115 [Selenomonas sp.]|jgi:hypothetical protein|nr:hypothetical protein [Selenomonas sp.]
MVQFRKILFLVVVMLFCTSAGAYAQRVQVSDLGAYKLMEQMNRVAQRGHSEFLMENLKHVGTMPNSPYDMYMASTGMHGHGSVVMFFCNKAGYVSKIVIMSKWGDEAAEKAAVNASLIALSAIGVNKSENDVLLGGNQLRKMHHSDVWCSRSNRRIVVQLQNKKNDVLVIRLTAYDN